MLQTLDQEWRDRVARCQFSASVGFEARGLTMGYSTILLAFKNGDPALLSFDRDAERDRMVALLAVAGNGCLAKASLFQLDAALANWARGEKALAAIRLAFARLPRLADLGSAYPLFLAEKALDVGLKPHELMRELGYISAIEPLLKFPGQPRMPKGSGPPSGEFAGGQSTGWQGSAAASIVPVFLDTKREHLARPEPLLRPEPLDESIMDGHALDPILPLGAPPVPLPTPPTPSENKDDEEKEDEKKGPKCPPMRPDRANGAHDSGDREEFRIAQIINSGSPTPKQTPENPDVTSMAYYLSRGDGNEVAIDDCKRTDDPVPSIPDLRKGDMVEVKTKGAATMATIKVLKAYDQYSDQLSRQMSAITLEGKGRRMITCVGTQKNVVWYNKEYGEKYSEARFVVCNP